MTENERLEIGKRIKIARDKRSLTLEDIAKEIGVAKSTIQRYETGKIQTPKIPVVAAIAEALGVNPSWLVLKSDQMYLSDSEGSTNQKSTLVLSYREHSHILTYRDLTDAGKDRVDTYTERIRKLEKQDEDSNIIEQFQQRFVARNGKNISPDQMQAIMDIIDGE